MIVQVVLCSSSGGRVSNGHVLTSDRHMSHVWDHFHWIPGGILPHFDPWHSPVGHLEAELVTNTCRHVKDTCHVSGNMSWPLALPSSSSGSRVSNRHVSTRDGHVSRVWEHVYWIPGKILPQFDPWHSPVPNLEAELQNIQNLEHFCRGCVTNFGIFAVMQKPRALLYTNMTLTKTPLPLEPLF